MFRKERKGFTLIELLVVIAIIGLLASMAMMALSNARLKSRDSRRVADIRQIRSALEMYFNDKATYPYGTIGGVVQSGSGSLGDASHLVLSSDNGFNTTASGTTYLTKVPADPGGESGYAYTYTSDGSTYTITFGLAGKTGQLVCSAGYDATCCRATPTGLNCSY